ncbi:MAG: hypothetical protein ACRBI6_21850 [Acidimicrobiales bacterium]
MPERRAPRLAVPQQGDLSLQLLAATAPSPRADAFVVAAGLENPDARRLYGPRGFVGPGEVTTTAHTEFDHCCSHEKPTSDL